MPGPISLKKHDVETLPRAPGVPKGPGLSGVPQGNLREASERSRLAPWCFSLCFFSSTNLGGGFKYFLFPSLFGEDSHFD